MPDGQHYWVLYDSTDPSSAQVEADLRAAWPRQETFSVNSAWFGGRYAGQRYAKAWAEEASDLPDWVLGWLRGSSREAPSAVIDVHDAEAQSSGGVTLVNSPDWAGPDPEAIT